ncbi:MAG TPA: hypothetical protein VFF68_01995, partial [Anaerolineaceae bacterium]|nr:hypothetical protein [Anaerolineaceae bacterium]
ELVVERQGHPYRSADGLASTGRKELEAAARELLVWLDLVPRPTPTAQPAPAGAALPVSPGVRLGESAAVRRPVAASMVAQIDEILQDMLTASTLPNRDIHLTERPGSGVLVWIGAQRYEGVDAVPEGEVKAILRAAVQEWERRQGG